MKEYKYDINCTETCAIQNQLYSCWECVDKKECRYFEEYLFPKRNDYILDCVNYCMDSLKNEIKKEIDKRVSEYQDIMVSSIKAYLDIKHNNIPEHTNQEEYSEDFWM